MIIFRFGVGLHYPQIRAIVSRIEISTGCDRVRGLAVIPAKYKRAIGVVRIRCIVWTHFHYPYLCST